MTTATITTATPPTFHDYYDYDYGHATNVP